MRAALALGRPRLAVREARRVHDIAPDEPATGRWVVHAYAAVGLPDSGVAVALRDALRRPASIAMVITYREALDSVRAPKWRALLAAADQDWLAGSLVQASARMDSLTPLLVREARGPSFCDDLAVAARPLGLLRPDLRRDAETAARMAGHRCGTK